MKVTDIINNHKGERRFSFEVLPPLKGNGTSNLFATIDKLKELKPLFINITNHSSEWMFNELENGQYERRQTRRRPGSVAVAAAIQNKYDIPVIPHVICSGVSADDIEYELLDLQFLGLNNILVLRGDKAKEDRMFTPVDGGHSHATELLVQIKKFNEGFFNNGTPIKRPGEKFCCGVAAYPEKHDEAPNLQLDLKYLKDKQDLGAEYAITQLFYDNSKYFEFVKKARECGITIPIIPAIKPFAKLSQISMVPRTFHVDMPQELAMEALKCKTDDDAKALGIEWTTNQCKELYKAGITDIHFFTVSAVNSVVKIVKNLM
jgi:methylenetetrahydrofolate reductase (NADPH)